MSLWLAPSFAYLLLVSALWVALLCLAFGIAVTRWVIAGIPPFAGFWSKDEILAGTGGFGLLSLLSVFLSAGSDLSWQPAARLGKYRSKTVGRPRSTVRGQVCRR